MEKIIKNNKKIKPLTGFTIIELLVAIAIIGLLSSVILFGITQYINRGKDASIAGNIAIFIPAGEIYYNNENNSYEGFCESSIISNAKEKDQMPKNPIGNCFDLNSNPAGFCCSDSEDQWAVCARKFSQPELAFCVDSRGRKKEIKNEDCNNSIIECP